MISRMTGAAFTWSEWVQSSSCPKKATPVQVTLTSSASLPHHFLIHRPCKLVGSLWPTKFTYYHAKCSYSSSPILLCNSASRSLTCANMCSERSQVSLQAKLPPLRKKLSALPDGDRVRGRRCKCWRKQGRSCRLSANELHKTSSSYKRFFICEPVLQIADSTTTVSLCLFWLLGHFSPKPEGKYKNVRMRSTDLVSRKNRTTVLDRFNEFMFVSNSRRLPSSITISPFLAPNLLQNKVVSGLQCETQFDAVLEICVQMATVVEERWKVSKDTRTKLTVLLVGIQIRF